MRTTILITKESEFEILRNMFELPILINVNDDKKYCEEYKKSLEKLKE